MKLKDFRDFHDGQKKLTDEQRSFLNRFIGNTSNWTQNEDGTIDVKGNFRADGALIEKLPVKFNRVTGDFNVANCRSLKTLEGCPKEVGGRFWCTNCIKLKSLEGSPEKVGAYYCCNCLITSLKGAPPSTRYFSCSDCKNLKSLMGAPLGADREFDFVGCRKIPRSEIDLVFHGDDTRDEWLKSGLTAEEFVMKRRGYFKGKKFGI